MWIICTFCILFIDIKCSETISLRCIVQHTGGCEQPCYSIFSKNVKVSELKPYRIVQYRTDDFRKEPYNFNYYNITIPLNESEMENFDVIENWGKIRQLWAEQKLQIITLWEIHPLPPTQKGCDKPVLNVVISVTQTQRNNNYAVVIHRVGKTVTPLINSRVTIPSLSCEELKSECESFHNETKLDFKNISFGEIEQIELRIWNTAIRRPLFIELLTSTCNINCENGTAYCKNGNVGVQNFTWYSYKSKFINASKPGYYCARIFPDQNMCCDGISTTSIEITQSKLFISVTYTPYSNMFVTEIIPNEFYITAIFIIALLSMGIILSISIRGKYKYCPYDGITSNEIVDDSLLFTDLTENTSPASSPHYQRIEVLLLYQKGSDEFLLMMKTLKIIISSYFSQVWDPFSLHLIEEISANPIEWIDKILSLSHIKVIIVNNEALQSDNLKDHHLNNLFKYAVTAIKNNPLLTHNYQRLFIIWFNSHITKNEFINIVPCTRYKIPDHLSQLIQDLAGVKPDQAVFGRRQPQLFWKQIDKPNSVLQNYHNKLSNAIL